MSEHNGSVVARLEEEPATHKYFPASSLLECMRHVKLPGSSRN
jgi:hypothetical protein